MGLRYLLFQIIAATSQCGLLSIFHTRSPPRPALASDKPLPIPAHGSLSCAVEVGASPREAFSVRHAVRTATVTRLALSRWRESVGTGDFIREGVMKQIKAGSGLEQGDRVGWRHPPPLAGVLSPLDTGWGSLGLLVTPVHSVAHREPGDGFGGGMRRWRKPWGLSPMRKGKRNYKLCPSAQN